MPRSTCFSRAISSRRAGKFFKILDSPIGLRMVTRASGELAIAHRPQLAAQGLLRDREPELFENPLAKIDQPPAHDAVHRWHRPALDDLRERRPVCVVSPRRLPGRLAIAQPFGPTGVDLPHPVANDLKGHAADLGRL